LPVILVLFNFWKTFGWLDNLLWLGQADPSDQMHLGH
jgi:hypothetical protein